jgi:eukaryotic-like serine/threonine-protein kinase
MGFGAYTIESRHETAGGGFDAVATDASGKRVCLWVGAPGRTTTPDGAGPDALRKTLARVYHSSLPRPLAADVIDDRAVLAFAAYDGRLLSGELAAGGPVDVPEAIDRVRTVAGALVKAHRAGLVHGALDAGEILLAGDGRTLLLHLGFSPFLEGRGARAPEDLDAPPADSSDVFALSRILVRCVDGEDPVPSPEALRALPVRDAESFTTDLPQGLRRLLARAIHPDPARRLSRAEELTGDLAVIRASWDAVAAAEARKAASRRSGARFPWAFAAVLAAAGAVLGLALRGC